MFKLEIYANNYNMKVYRLLNKIQNTILLPFAIASVFLVLSELSLIISNTSNTFISSVFGGLSGLFEHLIGYLFCFFITMIMTKGKRGLKGFWSIICLSVTGNIITDTAAFELFFIISLLIAFFSVFCFNHFDAWIAFIFTIVMSILVGLLVLLVDGYYNDFVMNIAGFISGKGVFSSVLFALFDSLSSLINSESVKNMIFHNSFGGAYFIRENIVTGVKDLFESGFNGDEISTYLSGHYFTLFAVCGAAASLFDELKGIQRVTLILTAVSAVLSGNLFLFLLFIFFESPMLFLFFSFVNILCYASAFLIKLGMGYIFNGSVIELIINAENIIYLISGGIIFICIGYFTVRIVNTKFGISDSLNTYIPSRLNKVVSALGGIMNIIRFKNDKLEVRNPELVDTLSLECEIEENIVSSNNSDFIDLKEYL